MRGGGVVREWCGVVTMIIMVMRSTVTASPATGNIVTNEVFESSSSAEDQVR